MRRRLWSSGVLTVLLVAGLGAAALRIATASWDGTRLTTAGSGQNGTTVTVTDSATGASLGSARVQRSRWSLTVERPAVVPCAVRASAGGMAVDQAVDGAPAGCSQPPPPPVSGSHAGRFSAFEGTRTCLACHQQEAEAFHQSVHYQWQGDASDAEGLSTALAGKMGGINDFCIYPGPFTDNTNWLGKLTTADGRQVDGGCARCHTGLGAKPSATPSQAQLENIDCLLCHSPSYKRTLQLVNGQFTFVADTANMTVPLLQAAVDIHLPTKDTCLNCHTKAGGGDNFKRGDLSEAHRTATPSLDVHLASRASGGAGLSCTDCHRATGHRIAGRGVDMRERDLPGVAVDCSNCHGAAPHGNERLDTHARRVACNACHVPSFARGAATDMRRDWSLPGEINAVTGLWEPNMVLRQNVTPVYRFFNGRSRFYEFATPAVPEANGRVLMAGPLGSITEAGSKITAMKRHEGFQPIDPVNRWLLPLKIGIFFQTGNVANAVTQGIAAMGWTNRGYEFTETERYMGVYHEVAPKEQALTCSTCHDGNRLDFAALGYTPLTTRNGRALCSSCHTARSASFYDLHDKHVGEKGFDCSTCHAFSKAV